MKLSKELMAIAGGLEQSIQSLTITLNHRIQVMMYVWTGFLEDVAVALDGVMGKVPAVSACWHARHEAEQGAHGHRRGIYQSMQFDQ
jgi:hypothetical protein